MDKENVVWSFIQLLKWLFGGGRWPVTGSEKEGWEWATCVTYMDGDITKKSIIVYAALKSIVHFLSKNQ